MYQKNNDLEALGTWTHWVVRNIPTKDRIDKNSVQEIERLNNFKKHSYKESCPLSNIRRYSFRIFIFDMQLDLNIDSIKRKCRKCN